MPILPRGITQLAELIKEFNKLRHKSIPGVVKWHYTLENDWSGDPGIFFWVVLTDDASKPEKLRTTKAAFMNLINKKVDLRGVWGLIPYFNFRSVSEQANLKDEVYEKDQVYE
jgi:hypothetical protein